MFELLKKIYSILSPSHRVKFIRIQLLVVLSAVFEVLSLAAMAPFIISITNPDSLKQNSTYSRLQDFFSTTTVNEFILVYGFYVLILLFIATTLAIFTAWATARFSYQVGSDIGNRLFTYYMYQPWVFHLSENTSKMSKNINTEATRVSGAMINPFIQMNSKIITSTLILLMLAIYNLTVSLTILGIFTVAYFIIYKVVKKKLLINGRDSSIYISKRFKLLNEGLGGIKDILLMNRQSDIINNFIKAGHLVAKKQADNQAMISAPKSLLELVVYSTIILVVMLIMKFFNIKTSEILPILSIYALAGIKLLPSFQQVYFSLSTITSNMGAFESINEELKAMNNNINKASNVESVPLLKLNQSIKLKNINFKYPNSKDYALKDINFEIKANDVVGIIGASGSGKSTLIDIILGLITPLSGKLLIDGKIIDEKLLKSWQKSIGYVSQSIYLSDATIRENIAFGLTVDEINDENINESIKLSQLDELVNSLPNGVNTRVGERGVQLSGGQRQRIGIARALYHKPSVLVFDEATSALDNETEKLIIQSVESLAGNRTIIMVAHRLSTLSPCNKIIELKNNSIYQEMTYDEII